MVIAVIAMAVACSKKDSFSDPSVYYYPDGSSTNNQGGNNGENDQDDPNDPYGADPGYPDGAVMGNHGPFEAGPEGYYTAVVTVKKDEAGQVYLWFAGRYRLNPIVNVQFERQCRALANLRQKSAINEGNAPVYVEWLEPVDDGIFTTDTSVKGSDGIDLLLNSWITTSDDGYLTLHYMTKWGKHPVHHDFYLVAGTDPEKPYTLELRHNANGDPKEDAGEGIINFDINSLPDTEGKTVKFELKWTNSAGVTQTANFGFRTRK